MSYVPVMDQHQTEAATHYINTYINVPFIKIVTVPNSEVKYSSEYKQTLNKCHRALKYMQSRK